MKCINKQFLYYLNIIISVSACNLIDFNEGNEYTKTRTDLIEENNLAMAGDICINELLFNPHKNCKDFIEIINTSERKIRVDNLLIASRDNNGNIKKAKPIADNALFLNSGDVLVLTEQPDTLTYIYPESNSSKFILCDIPTMNNDKGCVLILNTDTTLIDEFNYTEKMHNKLLNIYKGVSLERISLLNKTQQDNNWTSATASCKFATPGKYNSNWEGNNYNNTIEFSSPYISLNNDGLHDYLKITFKLQNKQWLANIKVFNLKGTLVSTPYNNYSISPFSKLLWFGMNGNDENLPSGVYIINIELWTLSGERIKTSSSVTLLAK